MAADYSKLPRLRRAGSSRIPPNRLPTVLDQLRFTADGIEEFRDRTTLNH